MDDELRSGCVVESVLSRLEGESIRGLLEVSEMRCYLHAIKE